MLSVLLKEGKRGGVNFDGGVIWTGKDDVINVQLDEK